MTDDRRNTADTCTSAASDHHERPRDRVTVDEVHRLLANSRRRKLLTYLVTRSADSVPVDVLIDIVAEREEPKPGPGTSRERIATDLHHVHLPKLADAGVITYDPVATTVRYVASELVEEFVATDTDDAEGR